MKPTDSDDVALKSLRTVLLGIVEALDEDRESLRAIRRGEKSLWITRSKVHLLAGPPSVETATEHLVTEIEDFLVEGGDG